MKVKKLINILLVISLFIPFLGVRSVQAAGAYDGICNGPDEVMTILVIGTDTRGIGYLYGMADTIMIFRVDFQKGEVSVMGIPRGLWVMIPDVEEDDGRTHGKLTAAYHFGTEGMGYYSGPGYGAGLLQATFKHNWDVEIDHYLVINMLKFRDLTDVIGGIKVYNAYPVYSHHQPSKPKVPVGGYLFSGEDALLYARYRDPHNVNDRVDRQAIILKALFEQIFSITTIPKLPEIIGLYKGNLLTDLHLAEVSQLLCLAAKTDIDNILFTRLSTDLLYIPDWASSPWMEKEPGSIARVLQEFLAGTWPEQP
jgi:LCP family protein required for cell wall assembly